MLPTPLWTDPSVAPADASLVIRGLRVDYGETLALEDLSLWLPRGEIFGLLGPNGAGKTTAFRVLATLLQPTHGEVSILGHRLDVAPDAARARIAYMQDLAPLPSDLRAREYLAFFARAHGLRGAECQQRVAECLAAVHLGDRANDLCQRLSLGMRQRLALAKSMLHRPGLMILDEPASGLDPLSRIELRDALRRQVAEGATVILSSHVLAELEDLCTSIGLLREGRLVDAGPLREVLARHGGGSRVRLITVPGRAAELVEWLARSVWPAAPPLRVDDSQVRIDLAADADDAELFEALGAAALGVTALRPLDTTIEDVIVNLSRRSQP